MLVLLFDIAILLQLLIALVTLPISNSCRSVGVASLASKQWFKLICGASNQDIPVIRNICAIYSSLGIDCIDLSADEAVILAAKDGVIAGSKLLKGNVNANAYYPLMMISVNDDEDPHFRKASFDVSKCPMDCPRPCEKVCPAFAIPAIKQPQTLPVAATATITNNGVISDKCYGCGRCLSVCPLGLIDAVSYTVDHTKINNLFSRKFVDAIEIHTQPNHQDHFLNLWTKIGSVVLSNAKVIAVSFPDMDDDTLPYLSKLQKIITDHSEWHRFTGVQVWQTDGRPMSGDIGRGTAHASSSLARRMLHAINDNSIPSSFSSDYDDKRLISNKYNKHFIQLAGGTNDYSSTVARREGLYQMDSFGGFAFGGYARKTITSYLNDLQATNPGALIEHYPEVLNKCVDFASKLVNTVKI